MAYAIGRNAGGSVQRNRIRRRLRAVLAELERGGRLPPGAYLIGAGGPAMTMPAAELTRTLEALVGDVTGTDA